MKMISGWIGVFIVFLSLLIQLLVIIKEKKSYKIFIIIQSFLALSAIFWIIYAFLGTELYWQTGINNVIIMIFNLIFVIINSYKWKKEKVVN